MSGIQTIVSTAQSSAIGLLVWISLIDSAFALEPHRQIYRPIAAFCGVPEPLLYAVARVESGRSRSGAVEPWPWTLNVAGQARYFESRQAQYQALMRAIIDRRSVDIGPMQLNWHWQFERLISPWQATDPYFNVVTGCRILRDLHRVFPGDWSIAIGKYHRSADAPRHRQAAQAYAARVLRVMDAES